MSKLIQYENYWESGVIESYEPLRGGMIRDEKGALIPFTQIAHWFSEGRPPKAGAYVKLFYGQWSEEAPDLIQVRPDWTIAA